MVVGCESSNCKHNAAAALPARIYECALRFDDNRFGDNRFDYNFDYNIGSWEVSVLGFPERDLAGLIGEYGLSVSQAQRRASPKRCEVTG